MKTKLHVYIAVLLLSAASIGQAQVTVTIDPSNATVIAGTTITLYADISSNGYCSGNYAGEWQHNGTNILSIITAVAGNGTMGYSGDYGAATSAELNDPNGFTMDSIGQIFIADGSNSRIRKVTTNGIIVPIGGGGSNYGTDGLGDGGPATGASFNGPTSIAGDSAGNLYICDNGNGLIRKIDTSGIVTVFAGGGSGGGADGLGDGGAATSAILNNPTAVTVDSANNVYISDNGDSLVRVVDTNGNITIVAGDYLTGYGYSGDGGAATSAQLSAPNGLWVDTFGNLYISDSDNCLVRRVDTNGVITTVAGSYAHRNTHSGDGGAATSAGLNFPNDVTVDPYGNLYIADFRNNVVREVDANGVISTVSGTGTQGYSGNGGPATSATMHTPSGVFAPADLSGYLYVADGGNNVIRRISNMLMQDGILTLPDVTTNDSGTYRAIISSPCGNVTNSTTLTVTANGIASINVTNFGAVADAEAFTVHCVSNAFEFSIEATNLNPGNASPAIGKIIEIFRAGPQLWFSNDPPYLTVPHYGSNPVFLAGGPVVTNQDIITTITNITQGTNLWCSIPAGWTMNAYCIVGTNNAGMFQGAVNYASNLVSSAGYSNVVINVPSGTYLMASPQSLDPNYYCAVPWGGNSWPAVTLSSGGITFLGGGSSPTNTILLDAGAAMERILGDATYGATGFFAIMRSSLFFCTGPVQHRELPLAFQNLTFDGGVTNGAQAYSYFIPYEGNGDGWDTSHHALCDYDPSLSSQMHSVKLITNCIVQHWRGEQMITFVGGDTNCENAILDTSFLDANATADNLGFGQMVSNCVFSGVAQVVEYYQANGRNDTWFVDNVMTNIGGNIIAINGATMEAFIPTYVIANNTIYSKPNIDDILFIPACNVIVSNNVFHGSGTGVAWQYDAQGDVTHMTNFVICNNQFNDIFLPLTSEDQGYEDVVISNNTSTGPYAFALFGGGSCFSTNFTLVGNTATGGYSATGVAYGNYPLVQTNNSLAPNPFNIYANGTYDITYANGFNQWIEHSQNSTFYLDTNSLIPAGAMLEITNSAETNVAVFYDHSLTSSKVVPIGGVQWFSWNPATSAWQ